MTELLKVQLKMKELMNILTICLKKLPKKKRIQKYFSLLAMKGM